MGRVENGKYLGRRRRRRRRRHHRRIARRSFAYTKVRAKKNDRLMSCAPSARVV